MKPMQVRSMLLNFPIPGEGSVKSGSSTSGSMRHRPLLASPYHMWRAVLQGAVAPGCWQAKRPVTGSAGPLVNRLGAVPARIKPFAGAVTDERPNTFQSWVPAHNVVVVGVFSCVTFCAFAVVANARRSVIHSKPRHKDSLRACVFVVFLIDVRLSRPEAWASRNDLRWSQLLV